MRTTPILLLLSLLFCSSQSASIPSFSRLRSTFENRLVFAGDAELLGLEKHPLVLPASSSSPFSFSPSPSSSETRKRQADDEALSTLTYSVYRGSNSNLDFHENAVDGTLRAFSWNQEDPRRIFILVDNVPYLSEDTGKTFIDISPRLENFTVEHGAHYGANSGGFGVRAIVKSTVDHNYVMLVGRGSNIWRSTDGGKTFQLINLKAGNDALYLRRVGLHPTKKELLVGFHIDSHCLDGTVEASDPVCSIEIYLTKDFGITWTLVGTHVWLFDWGVFKSVGGVVKDSLYLVCSRDRDSHQSMGTLDLLEVFTESLKAITVRENVFDMQAIGEYIYILAPPPGYKNFERLYVSHLGGPFKETSFGGAGLRGFGFLDYSEGTVLVADSPSEVSETYSDYRGDLWASDSTGTYFIRTLQRMVLQATSNSVRFDLHKIESLEGTYIATHLDAQSKLRTKISWNRAGSWQDVHSQAGLDGVVNEGSNPFVLLGEIHANNAGSHMGFYSEESAPGSVLAIGSYSVSFVEYVGGDSQGDVYFSRNGGKIFTKILDRLHYCRLLDEGSIIVCVPGYGSSSNTFLYSLDQGATWITEAFSLEAGDVLALYSDPDSLGLTVVILLNTNNRFRFITVDLTQLGLPPCTEASYERWMPSDSQDEHHCVLGHHSTYLRPKPKAMCESKLTSFLVKSENCPCGGTDFECDVGYFYNVTSATCAPEVGTPVQPIYCKDGFYPLDLHYRLIPGNTCNKTAPGAIDLEADVNTECPVDHLINENQYKHRLAIGLGLGVTFLLLFIIGAIAFAIWSKKKGYLQYRVLRNNEEGGGVELDMPDHPDEN